MCNHLMNQARLCGLKRSDNAVLVTLADMASRQNHFQCWPSVARIAFDSGFTVRTVQAALKRLEKAGHITRIFQTGRSNRYKVHPRKNDTSANSAEVQSQHRPPAIARSNPRNERGETKRNHNRKPACASIGQLSGDVVRRMPPMSEQKSAGPTVTSEEWRDLHAKLGG